MVKEESEKQLCTDKKKEKENEKEKEKEESMLTPPLKKPRNSMPHYTFLNSNVTINQSTRPATTSFPGSESSTLTTTKLSKDRINLTLTSQNVSDVRYAIKRTTPLKKILDAYNEHHNLQEGSIKLLFDGRYCHGHNTPNDMGMEDEDEITVVTDQEGG